MVGKHAREHFPLIGDHIEALTVAHSFVCVEINSNKSINEVANGAYPEYLPSCDPGSLLDDFSSINVKLETGFPILFSVNVPGN